MTTNFQYLNPDRFPIFTEMERWELAVQMGDGQTEAFGSIYDALRVADSATSFFRGRFRSATGIFTEHKGEFIDLPWRGDYADIGTDGTPKKSSSISAEVEAMSKEILAHVPYICEELPWPLISGSFLEHSDSIKRRLQLTTVEVLLMVDGFLTEISRKEHLRAIPWLSAAYLDLLHCTDLASAIIGTPSDSARNAAYVRHRENRQMKSEVFAWLDSNREKFTSNDDTAAAIAGRIVPVKFRTASAWVSEWAKLKRRASTP